MANRWGNNGKSEEISFWESPPKSLQMVTAALKLKDIAPWTKAMTHLDSILKGRDISLPVKVHLVKAVVFQVVEYECESWTIKKAGEYWRTRWWRSRWTWSTSLSTDTSEIYLQTQKVHAEHQLRVDKST